MSFLRVRLKTLGYGTRQVLQPVDANRFGDWNEFYGTMRCTIRTLHDIEEMSKHMFLGLQNIRSIFACLNTTLADHAAHQETRGCTGGGARRQQGADAECTAICPY